MTDTAWPDPCLLGRYLVGASRIKGEGRACQMGLSLGRPTIQKACVPSPPATIISSVHIYQGLLHQIISRGPPSPLCRKPRLGEEGGSESYSEGIFALQNEHALNVKCLLCAQKRERVDRAWTWSPSSTIRALEQVTPFP